MRVNVKICGLRRAADAARAVALGATHLGCVLAADSPRRANFDDVRAVCDASSGVPVVLVFRDAPLAEILAACDATAVRRVQVHGADQMLLAALAANGCIVHRVLRVDPHTRALPALEPPPSPSQPALLDVGRGGSGECFDWRLLGERAPPATFIAGGIDPYNVEELLPRAPWGIDLSSGVESAPGVKDLTRLAALFTALERYA